MQFAGYSNNRPVLTNQMQGQLVFLHKYGIVYFWLHVLAATLLCSLSWTKVASNTLTLSGWYFAVVLLAAASWLVKNRLVKDPSVPKQFKRYRFINIMLSGIWGASGVFLFDDSLIAQVTHLCLLLIIALSIWPLSIILSKDFYIQLALLLAPITLVFALQQNLKANILCIVVLAFVGIVLLLTHIFSKILSLLFAQQQSLLKQVHFDPVTQLVSNGHFNQVLKTEWQRSAREQKPLSLIMLEIDNFQAIKEKLGNKALNQYLCTITRCLKLVVRRSSDTIAHYDGADFVALLPGTDLDETKKLAERLQLELEQITLPNPLTTDQAPIAFTLGVSSCVPAPPTGVNRNLAAEPHAPVSYPATLLRCAEQALLKRSSNRDQPGHLIYRQDTPDATNLHWDQYAAILQDGWQPG